jgi:probable phosphoglycerate mutase
MNEIATPKKRLVCLLRHGDCRSDSVKRFLGQADPPLNDRGRAQAEAWQPQFSALRFEKIYASDLCRCAETAAILARGQSCQVQHLAELREIDLGSWEGLAMTEVRRRYPADFEKRGENLLSYRTPGGENFLDLAARVIPLFDELVCEGQGQLLIVAHSGVNRVLLSHILGLPLSNLFRLRQDYAGLNLIEISAQGLNLVGMNLGPGDRAIFSQQQDQDSHETAGIQLLPMVFSTSTLYPVIHRIS